MNAVYLCTYVGIFISFLIYTNTKTKMLLSLCLIYSNFLLKTSFVMSAHEHKYIKRQLGFVISLAVFKRAQRLFLFKEPTLNIMHCVITHLILIHK